MSRILDRAVVEALRLGHGRVGPRAAECPHLPREALREAWILRQPIEALYAHATAPRTVDPNPLELDRDPESARRTVAGTAGACIIAPATPVATRRADRCFFRRRNTSTLAERAPKTPRSREAATKPGSKKRARSDVGLCMR